MAMDNLHMKSMDIWAKLTNKLNTIQPTWKGLTQYQVITRVQNIRSKIQGSDLIQNIEDAELAKMKDSNKFFLQFNCSIADDTKEQTTME